MDTYYTTVALVAATTSKHLKNNPRFRVIIRNVCSFDFEIFVSRYFYDGFVFDSWYVFIGGAEKYLISNYY